MCEIDYTAAILKLLDLASTALMAYMAYKFKQTGDALSAEIQSRSNNTKETSP